MIRPLIRFLLQYQSVLLNSIIIWPIRDKKGQMLWDTKAFRIVNNPAYVNGYRVIIPGHYSGTVELIRRVFIFINGYFNYITLHIFSI